MLRIDDENFVLHNTANLLHCRVSYFVLQRQHAALAHMSKSHAGRLGARIKKNRLPADRLAS